jgi:hypothetical protein
VERIALIASLAALPLTALPAHPPKPMTSWGKAGVAFETYRADAIECGREGYFADVSDTEAAKVFKDASRRLENNETALGLAAQTGDLNRVGNINAMSQHIVSSTRPRERMREVAGVMNGTVAECLAKRGYVRFTLTEAQEKALKAYPAGTEARHHFLHALASDAKVLAAQGSPNATE